MIYLVMFLSVLAQNASFTLVSRARQTKSLRFHALAATCSNGAWLLVFRQLAVRLDNDLLMVTYLVASVLGSVAMHWLSMNYFEKKLGK